jgi:membrane-associated protease RseP (regulator of RpoE activity)
MSPVSAVYTTGDLRPSLSGTLIPFEAAVKISIAYRSNLRFSLLELCMALSLLMAGAHLSALAQTPHTDKPSQAGNQAQDNSDSEVLDNDAIVMMVRAKLSIKLITNAIRDNPGHYSLTSSSVIRLSREGVPEAVVKATQWQAVSTASSPDKDAASTHGPCLRSSAGWEITSRRDKITDAPFVEADSNFGQPGGPCVQITASCQVDSQLQDLVDKLPTKATLMQMMQGAMDAVSKDAPKIQPQQSLPYDARTLKIQFRYFPPHDSNLALLAVSPQLPRGFPQQQESCAHLRVKVDNWIRSDVRSRVCNIPNLAAIEFPTMHFRDVLGYEPNGSVNSGGLLGLLSPTVGGTLEADGLENVTLQTVTLMRDALDSSEILVELPLTDGGTTIVPIHPQEPGFRQFASTCLSTFPDPPKIEIKPEPGGPLGIEVEQAILDLPSRGSRSITTLHGLKVTRVYGYSPARYAGIRLDDVITSVNGQPVSSKEDIAKAIVNRNPSHAEVSLYRDGLLLTFNTEPNPVFPSDLSQAAANDEGTQPLSTASSHNSDPVPNYPAASVGGVPVGPKDTENGDLRYIRLTPTNPSATRQADIFAPGAGVQNYNIFTIDTSAFPNGAVLSVDISVSGDSRTGGSFDLFPANFPIPKLGRPVGTLVGKYDVPPGNIDSVSVSLRSMAAVR